MKKKIPHFIRYLFLNALCLWLFLFLGRLLFFIFFLKGISAKTNVLYQSWQLGIRFDLKLVCILLFPLAIVLILTRSKFFIKLLWRKISGVYLFLVYASLLLFYIFDAGYYQYLNTRLDGSALKFLSDFKTSFWVLWESYPVVKGLLFLAVILYFIRKIIQKNYDLCSKSPPKNSRKKNIIFSTLAVLLLSFGIYNSCTHYPLRWSEAFFDKDSRVNQFTLNPVLYFFESFTEEQNLFDLEKTRAYYPKVAQSLQLPKDTLNFERQVTFKDTLRTKPNVVFVMLESLGASVMSFFGNPIATTPKMDSIATKSLFFTNLFVHKVGTAASVFASITGLPDVVDGTTASRTPMIIDQRILFDQYKGYEKFYFLGGSANWANIRGVFSSNITGLKIFEEGSYQQEKRADVWGIDDYELFKAADAILKTQKKPFLAYIQTSSNHMPFTYPNKKETFRAWDKTEMTEELLKKGGFRSLEQLNALRYLDFNVYRFLERAKKSGYYENTIFVFFGDHNTWVDYFDFTPLKEFELELHLHHVPAFIHAPQYTKPRNYKNFAKLIDLFPTATHLAKQNHTNYTLGMNLLDSLSTSSAFLYTKLKGENAIGVLQNNFYYLKSLQSAASQLVPLSDKKASESVKKSLDSLARGFYESTRYLYFNNKK